MSEIFKESLGKNRFGVVVFTAYLAKELQHQVSSLGGQKATISALKRVEEGKVELEDIKQNIIRDLGKSTSINQAAKVKRETGFKVEEIEQEQVDLLNDTDYITPLSEEDRRALEKLNEDVEED